jgi:hypothetical protein
MPSAEPLRAATKMVELVVMRSNVWCIRSSWTAPIIGVLLATHRVTLLRPN